MKKIALITGASGGLGQAVASELSANDYQLVLVSRDIKRLQRVYGNQHYQIEADCSTLQGVNSIFEYTQQHTITPTALAHCVGNIRLGALHRLNEVDFLECIQTNLFSAFYTLTGFVQQLKTQQLEGKAVFVSSAAASIGTANHEAIATAKGGLEALVRSAAASYASIGIRINAISPGIVDTAAAAKILSSDLSREMAAKQYPIAGIGNVEDLASLMAWLLSENANRVTGQIWSIDGGFSAIRPIVK